MKGPERLHHVEQLIVTLVPSHIVLRVNLEGVSRLHVALPKTSFYHTSWQLLIWNIIDIVVKIDDTKINKSVLSAIYDAFSYTYI